MQKVVCGLAYVRAASAWQMKVPIVPALPNDGRWGFVCEVGGQAIGYAETEAEALAVAARINDALDRLNAPWAAHLVAHGASQDGQPGEVLCDVCKGTGKAPEGAPRIAFVPRRKCEACRGRGLMRAALEGLAK